MEVQMYLFRTNGLRTHSPKGRRRRTLPASTTPGPSCPPRRSWGRSRRRGAGRGRGCCPTWPSSSRTWPPGGPWWAGPSFFNTCRESSNYREAIPICSCFFAKKHLISQVFSDIDVETLFSRHIKTHQTCEWPTDHHRTGHFRYFLIFSIIKNYFLHFYWVNLTGSGLFK